MINNKLLLMVIVLLFFAGCGSEKQIENRTLKEEKSNSYYKEAPMLKELVENGELPSVENRVSGNPRLIQPVTKPGIYGGSWKAAVRSVKNKGTLVAIIGYENLVCWDPEWTKVIPNIAQSWSVDDDSKIYTFTLRKGMKWSDGHPFTVDDIIYYYEIMTNPDIRANGLPKWLIVDDEPVEIRKTGENQVTFEFVSSYGLFLQKMATSAGRDMVSFPKHYMEQFIEADYDEDIYHNWQHQYFAMSDFVQNPELPTLYAWQLKDSYYPLTTDKLTAVRNPYYWKIDSDFNQLPYIDEIEFLVCDDQNEIDLRTLAGEFDMSTHALPDGMYGEFKELVESDNFNFFNRTPSSMNNMTIEFNWNHPEPEKREMFQNKNFRIALSHGINRERIIEDFYEGNAIPYQLGPRPESPFYNRELAEQYTEYNPEFAVKLLEEEGYYNKEDPIKISLVFADLFGRNWPGIAEYIKEDWAKLGIELELIQRDWKGLDEFRNYATHDVLVWQGSGGLEAKIIPDYYFPRSSEAGYAMRWMWWYNGNYGVFPVEEPPEVVKKQMELYDKLKATADNKEQDIYMNEILEIAVDQFYALGICLPENAYGIVNERMKNVPQLMPEAWAYPTPGPTNPCQFYFE